MEEPGSEKSRFHPDTQYIFTISVAHHESTAISPAALYLFDPEQEHNNIPDALFTDEGNGTITAILEKNTPYVAEIHSAWHKPLQLFLPSFSGDQIEVSIQPEPLAISRGTQPAVIGNFNHYDDFSSFPMIPGDDGMWHAVVEAEPDTLAYVIVGMSAVPHTHGTTGSLRPIGKHSSGMPGIESIMMNEGSNRFVITFDPSLFPAGEETPTIHFDKDTPVSFAGIATAYSAMVRQAEKVRNMIKRGESVSATHFDTFHRELQKIREAYPHPETDQAIWLAKANFSEYLNPKDESADRLIAEIPPNSELWLFYIPVLSELYDHSSRMEQVSRNLWDIYRQHNHRSVQGEALFNLLRFHYERGEDEEWHQAHFDLVREYPGHPRINYSYKRGYAPEAVVHVGRYFPRLQFSPLFDGEPKVTPADNDAPVTILYFWSVENEESRDHIEELLQLHELYSDIGLEISTIALGNKRERVQRFHEQSQLPWQSGFEQFSSPVIQSIGITEVPYTIVLNLENRVLVLDEEFLSNRNVIESIGTYLRNSL